jgi:hypothetical protein
VVVVVVVVVVVIVIVVISVLVTIRALVAAVVVCRYCALSSRAHNRHAMSCTALIFRDLLGNGLSYVPNILPPLQSLTLLFVGLFTKIHNFAEIEIGLSY